MTILVISISPWLYQVLQGIKLTEKQYWFNNKLDTAPEKAKELEDKTIETFKTEGQGGKRTFQVNTKSLCDLWGCIK